MQVDCVCMEFAAAGLYIVKYLRLDQTVRDPTCGNWETLFVVIRLGVTGLEQIGFVCLQYPFEGRVKEGWWRGSI